MDFFKVKDLRRFDVDAGERYKGRTLRAFCEVTIVLRGALLRVILWQKSARKNDAKQPSGERVPDNRGGESHGEVMDDLKAALVKASEKHRLPIRGMAEFFSPEWPRGVTLAEAPGALYIGKEGEKVAFENIACVLVRQEDGAKARVFAFPLRLKKLFNGRNDGLIFTRLIRHGK